MRRTAHDPPGPEAPYRAVGGHKWAHGPKSRAAAEPARLVPHLQWQASYDLASVDRLVGWLESDRADLERQITQARARTEQARAAAAHRAATEVQLDARIAVRRRELDAIEQRHREVVDAIHAVAGNEAALLIAEARKEADAMRAAAAAAGTQSERWRTTP